MEEALRLREELIGSEYRAMIKLERQMFRAMLALSADNQDE